MTIHYIIFSLLFLLATYAFAVLLINHSAFLSRKNAYRYLTIAILLLASFPIPMQIPMYVQSLPVILLFLLIILLHPVSNAIFAKVNSSNLDIEVSNFSREFVSKNDKKVKGRRDLLVVIVSQNQAQKLQALLNNVPKQTRGLRIKVLVVDCHSKDASVKTAFKAKAIVANAPEVFQKKEAINAGYIIAKEMGYRYVISMNVEVTNAFSSLSVLIGPLLRKRADIVIGSRYLHFEGDQNIKKTMRIKLLNKIASMISGLSITDCATNLKAIDVRVINTLQLEDAVEYTSELIVLSAYRGLRILEAPVSNLTNTQLLSLTHTFMLIRSIIVRWVKVTSNY